MHLYELLADKVTLWRRNGYPAPDHLAITEVLDYARRAATRFEDGSDISPRDIVVVCLGEEGRGRRRAKGSEIKLPMDFTPHQLSSCDSD
jgi:hypothetical protein